MRRVELHPAYHYTCESCGRENWVRAVVVEMTPEEEAEKLPELGPHFTGGHWMTSPGRVRCRHCGEEYETVDWGLGGEED